MKAVRKMFHGRPSLALGIGVHNPSNLPRKPAFKPAQNVRNSN
jgi:hypothetical protein